MKRRDNTPALVGIIVALLGIGIASNVWLRPTPPASAGVNHVETETHSPNVLPAGDYHIEAQVDGGGKVTLFVYGKKEGELLPIPTLDVEGQIEAQIIVPGENAVPLTISPDPVASDPAGHASRFSGRFARRPDMARLGLSLMMPISGRMHRVHWGPEQLASDALATGGDAAMPEAVGSEEAKTLFLTPGGRYTAADIEANGRTTASAKYGNKMSSHNAHPKPGDRLCPISETVANPKFAWTIDGKVYTFCCPPCIEEFVSRAKEQPDTLKDPDAYIKS